MVLLTMRFWTAPIGGQGVMFALTGSLKLPPVAGWLGQPRPCFAAATVG